MTEQGAVQPRLQRSCLAVPGSSQKMLQRAASLPADDVFLDLEDSVASHAKTDESREKVVRALIENECAARTLAVRVNSVATPWCFQDPAALTNETIEASAPR